jgi:hypothetical protein
LFHRKGFNEREKARDQNTDPGLFYHRQKDKSNKNGNSMIYPVLYRIARAMGGFHISLGFERGDVTINLIRFHHISKGI